MNCQEAQLQLSAYLEKSLDSVRMKSIENHLLSCLVCRAESHALADCIKQIADLPLLDPPEGFAGRIMARAREIEIEPVFWRRLTGAFRNTLPIQAAAVILVSVLAVLLYEKNGSFKALAPESLPPAVSQPSSASTVSPARETAAAPAASAAAESGARAKASTPQSRQEPAASRSRELAASTSAKRTATPRAPAAEESVTSETPMPQAPVAPRRRPIQAQEVSTGSEAYPGPDALSVGAAIGALNRSPFGRSAFRGDNALSPLSNPSADYEFVVKRRPRERREVAAAVTRDASASRSGAPGAPSGTAINSPIEIRWFTVLPEHYDEFRKELAAEAIIDAEKPAASKDEFGFKRAGELLIKVTILPADR